METKDDHGCHRCGRSISDCRCQQDDAAGHGVAADSAATADVPCSAEAAPVCFYCADHGFVCRRDANITRLRQEAWEQGREFERRVRDGADARSEARPGDPTLRHVVAWIRQYAETRGNADHPLWTEARLTEGEASGLADVLDRVFLGLRRNEARPAAPRSSMQPVTDEERARFVFHSLGLEVWRDGSHVAWLANEFAQAREQRRNEATIGDWECPICHRVVAAGGQCCTAWRGRPEATKCAYCIGLDAPRYCTCPGRERAKPQMVSNDQSEQPIATDLLCELREILGVPEGRSLVEFARKLSSSNASPIQLREAWDRLRTEIATRVPNRLKSTSFYEALNDVEGGVRDTERRSGSSLCDVYTDPNVAAMHGVAASPNASRDDANSRIHRTLNRLTGREDPYVSPPRCAVTHPTEGVDCRLYKGHDGTHEHGDYEWSSHRTGEEK